VWGEDPGPGAGSLSLLSLSRLSAVGWSPPHAPIPLLVVFLRTHSLRQRRSFLSLAPLAARPPTPEAGGGEGGRPRGPCAGGHALPISLSSLFSLSLGRSSRCAARGVVYGGVRVRVRVRHTVRHCTALYGR